MDIKKSENVKYKINIFLYMKKFSWQKNESTIKRQIGKIIFAILIIHKGLISLLFKELHVVIRKTNSSIKNNTQRT